MDETMDDDTIMQQEKVVPIGSKLIKSVRDLEVYKRAYRVSLEIHRVTLLFPKVEQYALADQLRRATKSVCANLAEGFVRQKYSAPEFLRFLAIAESSAGEVQVWLQYAKDLEYITQLQFTQWEDDYYAISAMLSKLRRKN